jgi:peptidoglycan/LPS O-acetylase OafA/YrhL
MQDPSTPNLPLRSQPLDILRALAVFLVLGRHIAVCPLELNRPLHFVTEIWARGGWIGVDLFFVLSGFLVSGLLFKEQVKTGSVSVGRFLIRRGFKIYPAFYVLIAATVVLIPGKVTAPKLLAEVFFVQNYFTGLWGHTWSLAVEEHFYFLLSLTFGYLPPLRRFIPVIFLVVAVVCLAARIYTVRHYPFSNDRNLFPTHLRLDSLSFGVGLAYLKYYRPRIFTRLKQRWLLLPGVCALMPAFIFPLDASRFMQTFGYTVIYLGSGLILLAVLETQLLPGPAGRIVAWLGARSYSLYLWHLPVLVVASRISNWYIFALVYLSGSVVVGILMNTIVEAPMLKVRDRFFPPVRITDQPAA